MTWKALPGSLDPHGRQLVAELRRLKDHTGLSLKSLQAKTPFSASSWERYLNGKVLPPEKAVEDLAKFAGADAVSLLALRAAAEGTWNTATEASAGSSAADREAAPGRPEIRVAALSLAAGALLLSAVVSVLLIVDPWGQHTPASPQGAMAGVGKYTCAYTRRGDLLFAGNSTTTSHLVMRNSTGPDAAEVQCLLRRHKLSAGDVDGYFGEHTEAGVKQLQHEDHVPADGIVGEQTWALLRHVQ
ncbi:peptidoglycan-binding protein [Streptomyces sioyaensis]|uniref:peptidoglycan-binding protein n=1 Tax=Streptomyces sioyaensis TaxID=67364 RepID=UPI00378FF213